MLNTRESECLKEPTRNNYFTPTTLSRITLCNKGVSQYLNDQEDIGRWVCDGENGRTGQCGYGYVRRVGFKQPFHLIRVQVKVEILRDLLEGRL